VEGETFVIDMPDVVATAKPRRSGGSEEEEIRYCFRKHSWKGGYGLKSLEGQEVIEGRSS
jgi:hypothetical protein